MKLKYKFNLESEIEVESNNTKSNNMLSDNKTKPSTSQKISALENIRITPRESNENGFECVEHLEQKLEKKSCHNEPSICSEKYFLVEKYLKSLPNDSAEGGKIYFWK